MEFEYKIRAGRIESPSQEIYVQECGMLPQRQLWVLHYQNKKIGFLTSQKRTPSKIEGAKFCASNCILSIGDRIVGGGPDEPVFAEAYRFRDEQEQNEIVQIIVDALSAYNGADEKPKDGTVKVIFSEMAERQLKFGRLIAKSRSPLR